MNNKSAGERVRMWICAGIAVTLFIAFAFRLFDWQIIKGDTYRKLNAASVSYTETSDATRGEILDSNGVALAVNTTAYNIVINKIYIADSETNSVIMKLMDILSACSARFIDALPIEYRSGAFVFCGDYASDVEYIESDIMLGEEGLSAEEIVEKLAERYDASDIDDKERKRAVVSVRYNMEKKGYSYSQAYVFASDVSPEVVAVVSERTLTTPGVEIRAVNDRVIKKGSLIPHLLGVVGALSSEEYDELKDKGYALDDTVGKFGIEAALEDELRGEAGVKTITKDSDGNVIKEEESVKASPGNTVYLTIDSAVQEAANYSLELNINRARAAGAAEVAYAKYSGAKQKSLLGEDCYTGAAVMLDLRDFSIIACASAPNYDISKYYDPDYSEWLFTDEHSPMFNRAVDGAFSPGSSFKPCVAAAALEEGVITEKTEIKCTGHYDYYKNDVVNCLSRHGAISLKGAMAQSCNYFFAEVGRRTGITTMYLYAEKFGLGVKTGVEIGESSGVLAGRDSETWYEGNTVQAAIGQSDNTFTPLQLATYVATIANNGIRYRAHLVRKITDYERENTVLFNDPEHPEIISDAGVSEKNIKKVQSAMRSVVTDGTAAEYAGKYPIAMAAKTGTAENAGSDHVTFIAYAPYNDPKIAVAVVLEHGAKGRYAQYVAMDMMDAYFNSKTLSELKKHSWGN